MTLAILVAGFFVGRSWLRRLDYDAAGGDEEFGSQGAYERYKAWRDS